MDADSVTLDNSTFKALASETRVSILKSLDQRRKTASELSKEMHATVQGISEHLHSLQQAGLVERKESGRKWVYYQLTSKGSAVLHPDSKKFWVLVSLSFLAFFGYLLTPYLFNYDSNAMLAQDTASSAAMALPQGTPAPEAMGTYADSSAPAAGAESMKSTEAQIQALEVSQSDAQMQQGEPAQEITAAPARAASSLSSTEGLFLVAAALFLAGAGWIKLVKKSA